MYQESGIIYLSVITSILSMNQMFSLGLGSSLILFGVIVFACKSTCVCTYVQIFSRVTYYYLCMCIQKSRHDRHGRHDLLFQR